MKFFNSAIIKLIFLILITSQFILSRRVSKKASKKFHTHTRCQALGAECKRTPHLYSRACCNGMRCDFEGNKKICKTGKKDYDDTCDHEDECVKDAKCDKSALGRSKCV